MPAKKEKNILIKEAQLTNNCPECFSDEDLTLYFYQRIKSNRFYIKVTREITQNIICKKCKSTIFPARWTDDIERVFTYYDKTVQPRKASLRFTSTFYILILLLVIMVAFIITFLIYRGFI
jgi:hypothetical protein